MLKCPLKTLRPDRAREAHIFGSMTLFRLLRKEPIYFFSVLWARTYTVSLPFKAVGRLPHLTDNTPFN